MLRYFRECEDSGRWGVPDKKAKKPDYKRSLSNLRGMNFIEEERRIPLKRLFELFDNCMKDIEVELKTPHLSNIDRADALIAAITATNILLNELGLEEEPLRELSVQLRNRRLGSPDPFVFNQSPRPNSIEFNKEVLRVLIVAMYEEDGPRREEAYKWAKALLKMNKDQVRNLAANVRHRKIDTPPFRNLIEWTKEEINKPDFDIMSNISI
jgi:hypothetical protein